MSPGQPNYWTFTHNKAIFVSSITPQFELGLLGRDRDKFRFWKSSEEFVPSEWLDNILFD